MSPHAACFQILLKSSMQRAQERLVRTSVEKSVAAVLTFQQLQFALKPMTEVLDQIVSSTTPIDDVLHNTMRCSAMPVPSSRRPPLVQLPNCTNEWLKGKELPAEDGLHRLLSTCLLLAEDAGRMAGACAPLPLPIHHLVTRH